MVEWGIKSYLGPAETKSFVTASVIATGATRNPALIDLALSLELGWELIPRFPFVISGI